MLDAANLQEEEARRQRTPREARRGQRADDPAPLYTVLDALNSSELFRPDRPLRSGARSAPGVRATFLDAGHILGSASVLLELTGGGERRCVLFSGDLGNSGRPLLRDPVTPKHADVVVMETTYGDRLHKALGPSVEELYEAISDTFERGGNVIIPTFALERAQELLFYLREGVASRAPAAARCRSFSIRRWPSLPPKSWPPSRVLRAETCAQLFRDGSDPFDLPGLHFTRETAESIALNRITAGAVIMAGSGMCTGGRVRHHLQAQPVAARVERRVRRLRGAWHARPPDHRRRKEVKIFGEPTQVRASIHTINGFSAHAGPGRTARLAWRSAAASAPSSCTARKTRCASSRASCAIPRSRCRRSGSGSRCSADTGGLRRS